MFIKSFGVTQFILVVLLYTINQVLITGSSVWLTHWSDQSVAFVHEQGHNASEFDNGPFIGVYAALGFGTAIAAFLRNVVILVAGALASRKIHNNLFKSFMKSKLGFVQSTSSGSYISRFSADLDQIDNTIPNAISSFLFNVFDIGAAIITIAISSAYFLIAVLPICLIMYGIKIFYVQTSRQLKRLESSSNAPIYRHFNETVRGIEAVKAFDHINRFKDNLDKLMDKNLCYTYYSLMCTRWLILRTELIAQFLVLAAALVAVVNKDSFTSGWAGLIVTLALSITESFNYLLNNLTSLEDQATVIERIKEMTKHSPQEPEWVSSNPPDSNWPSNGTLTLQNYSTGYDEDDPENLVLRNLELNIKSGEKIAVVGRTGAGKSSLALALLRVLEAKTGKILLDGFDISQLGLHELRKAITIIPQEPVLFAGTIKSNVDPVGSLSDATVAQCLKATQMDISVDDIVEEGGANYSLGQRQLVCLARAIARRSKLIILDEATASVDEFTDQLIQRAIRTEFSASTVFTIAHRLNTILDYDRVVVLENGRVLEVGSVEELRGKEDGVFRSMINEMETEESKL